MKDTSFLLKMVLLLSILKCTKLIKNIYIKLEKKTFRKSQKNKVEKERCKKTEGNGLK